MNSDNVTIWNCPEPYCNGKLIRRVNSRTQEEFLGCTEFPKCKYTQKIEEDK